MLSDNFVNTNLWRSQTMMNIQTSEEQNSNRKEAIKV